MDSLTSEAFRGRVDELWPQYQSFLVRTIHATEFGPKSAASLDKQAKEMIGSVDDLRPQVDAMDVHEEQRTVWHGSLSVFKPEWLAT
jgi:hypothetical protein